MVSFDSRFDARCFELCAESRGYFFLMEGARDLLMQSLVTFLLAGRSIICLVTETNWAKGCRASDSEIRKGHGIGRE